MEEKNVMPPGAAYLKNARLMASEAGRYLREHLRDRHHVRYKGEIDIVTEADQAAEELIVGTIRSLYPGHDVLAEESPATSHGSPFRWIVDPLDGTTNYSHGYPVFCVSIALEIQGVCVVGVVYNPMLEEMFTAVKGQGAFLNGEPIAVSRTAEISRSLLATGFPYDIRFSPENNMNYFGAMAVNVQAIRRAGSAALDLAYVAAGRFDGFWELKLKPWDMAAGCLLVSEAGGRVTDIHGSEFSLDAPHVAASNGIIHARMLDILASAALTGR